MKKVMRMMTRTPRPRSPGSGHWTLKTQRSFTSKSATKLQGACGLTTVIISSLLDENSFEPEYGALPVPHTHINGRKREAERSGDGSF